MSAEFDTVDPAIDVSNLRSLFWEQVPVVLQRAGREDCVQYLSTRLLLGCTPQQQALRVVRMYLFSDVDLLLLYSLEVTEDDFQTLKAEQGILVDFLSFSDKVIQLLKRCVECHNSSNPSFQAVLGIGTVDSCFKVVERNDFNQVSHINLCFRHGTESAVKEFLAFRLTESRHQLHSVQAQLDSKVAELHSAQHEHEKAMERASDAESSLQHVVEESEMALHNAESSNRQGRIVQREELLRAFEMEKGQIQHHHARDCVALRSKLETVTCENSQLLHHNSTLVHEITDLQASKRHKDEQLHALQQKCSQVQEVLQQVQMDCENSQATLSDCKSALSQSKEHTRAQEVLIAEQHAHIQELEECNHDMQHSFHHFVQSVQDGGVREQDAAAQISKGNSIIAKFVTSLQHCRSKVKRKQSVMLRQEEELARRQMELQSTQINVTDLQTQLKDYRSAMEQAYACNHELKQRLLDCKNVLKGNEQMIRWLNTQVTQVQMADMSS